jgi:hypothetical protein
MAAAAEVCVIGVRHRRQRRDRLARRGAELYHISVIVFTLYLDDGAESSLGCNPLQKMNVSIWLLVLFRYQFVIY